MSRHWSTPEWAEELSRFREIPWLAERRRAQVAWDEAVAASKAALEMARTLTVELIGYRMPPWLSVTPTEYLEAHEAAVQRQAEDGAARILRALPDPLAGNPARWP